MEYKAFPSFTKQVDDREVTGFAAVLGNLDAQNDITHRGAFKKSIQESGRRVRHLWQHDAMQPPIAAITDLREVGKRDLPAELKAEFPDANGGLLVTRKYLDTERANEVLAGLASEPPAITEMSFGYDPIKFDFDEGEEKGLIRNLREVRLWDTSDVNWGANQATMAAKAALPFRDTGMLPDSTAWDAPSLDDFASEQFGELSAGERNRIAAHYAFAANRPPEQFSELSLPHHRAGTSGVGPAVWRGVAAAMAALLGARGGANIPDGDRRAVYDHLAAHYAQFDREPPEFKLVQLAGAVKDAVAVAQFGEFEYAIEEMKLAEKIRELYDLLSAEPTPISGTLTAAHAYANYQRTLARLRGVVA